VRMSQTNVVHASPENQRGSIPAGKIPPLQFPTGDSRVLSSREVFGAVIFSYAVFYVALFFWGGLGLVGGDQFGDNPAYLELATAIRHWQFAGITAHQFWGVSYATAGLSFVTRMPLRASLVVVCVVSSLVTISLCYRLWGGWVAVFFALLSFDWFQRSLLGGSESLFVALVLVAFARLRRDKWRLAAVAGALATVVRPYGLFALIGIGIQLLRQKKFKECFSAVVIALLIGAAYAWPMAHYLGDAFANVTAYRQSDWHGGFPYTFPFITIVRDTFNTPAPATSIVLTSVWVVLVVAGIVVAVMDGDLRCYARSYLAEICFVCLFCTALVTYNSREWARTDFPRFALPVLPWILVFLYRFLPKKRSVVWTLAVITPILAAASAIGIRNVLGLIGHHRY
jgi:hypothetical protein